MIHHILKKVHLGGAISRKTDFQCFWRLPQNHSPLYHQCISRHIKREYFLREILSSTIELQVICAPLKRILQSIILKNFEGFLQIVHFYNPHLELWKVSTIHFFYNVCFYNLSKLRIGRGSCAFPSPVWADFSVQNPSKRALGKRISVKIFACGGL